MAILLSLCGIGKSERGKVVSKAPLSERISQVASTGVLATLIIRSKNQPFEPVWRRSIRFPHAVFMYGYTK